MNNVGTVPGSSNNLRRCILNDEGTCGECGVCCTRPDDCKTVSGEVGKCVWDTTDTTVNSPNCGECVFDTNEFSTTDEFTHRSINHPEICWSLWL